MKEDKTYMLNENFLGTYLGIKQPMDRVWSDGRNVTIYPNGDVIAKETGFMVRQGETQNIFKPADKVEVENLHGQNVLSSVDPNVMLIIGVVGIIAITGIILHARK